MSESLTWPAALRSEALRQKIATSKVLCVGAGGIGCELLKTLVCTGFKNIEVIDLDTIETSNLNRQFLFRKHHVGESKARTAAAVVRTVKPDASIVAHHSNVKEACFGIDYISGFSLVLNGLDNLEARKHVNRLAMAAGVPLIESGTAGYLGQATVHLKGETECFECNPPPVPKSFPICTLRNTPDKPIHCVVWSKDLLFARLFGKQDEITDLDEGAKVTDGDGDDEDLSPEEKLSREEAARQAAEEASAFIRQADESPAAYAVRIFEKVYDQDITRLAGITEMWKSRKPPTPHRLSDLFPDRSELDKALDMTGSKPGVVPSKALGCINPNQKWSVVENARIFMRSIVHYLTHRQEELGQATFDKDDDLAVDFVTAASNLRSECYAIPTQSLFEAKGMAGNIIHAIATTNAIVSGLIVVEALKLLAGCKPASRSTYLKSTASGRILAPTKLQHPKSTCHACSKAVLTLQCNTTSFTLQQLVAAVVKGRLALMHPALLCGNFMYEEDPDMDEDEVEDYQRMLPKALASLPDGGLVNGKLVSVTDASQVFICDIRIVHQDQLSKEAAPDGFVLIGEAPAPQPLPEPVSAPAEEAAPPAASKPVSNLKVTEDAGGAICIDDSDDDVPQPAAKPGKRGRDEDGDEGVAKKARFEEQMNEDGVEVMILDDD